VLLISSFLFIINLLLTNIYILLIMTFLLMFISSRLNFKKLPKFIYFFYFTLAFSKIFFIQEGQVVLKILNVYITKESLLHCFLNYIKILNVLLLSKFISKNIKIGDFKNSYTEILEIIVVFVPQIMTMFKKRVGIQDLYKKILINVYRKL